MLYVFQMDVGQMLIFEISLLMDTVSTLQQELAKVTGISVDKQILLVSGGHSLKPQQKVISYGAGTDTNPVFLFSKQAIESQEPPLVKSFGVAREVLSALKDKVTEAINLPAVFETVSKRTKTACEIRDNANKVLAFCSNEFKEQHLQYQGWGTVVANLEEIAQAMQKTEAKFTKAFTSYLPQREKHFTMLDNFQETIRLLDRIPLLKSLKDNEVEDIVTKGNPEESVISFIASSSGGPSTLLEWIITQGQGQSIEVIQHKCYDDLLMFDSEMFARLDREVQEQLLLVMDDPHHMKELVGIERRLSELEKRLNEAKRIAQEQSDMAQGFLMHQARLSSTQSPALILPDLCRSHQQQLKQMLERQQRIETLQSNFMKSKQEMSTNIHQRLGWVMHIETQICKLDSDLIYHLKTLRILEHNLELLSQVKAAPQVYADMVVEAARRRIFSSRFLQWANTLVDDSKQLYLTETERRKQFAKKLGEHFLLDTLFKGFEDMPPSFATKVPPSFDTHLPEITLHDITLLKNAVPELEEFLNVSIDSGFVLRHLLSKGLTESPQLQMFTPQSSQTEWTEPETTSKPCIIMATEAPPTKFTLPEMQAALITQHLPPVLNLTEPVRTTKYLSDHSSTKGSEAVSESSSSVAISDSSPAVQSVKTQTKTNSTHTDSTSPISSNEFATADFYFEDSMPSPMADSPHDKKEEKKIESSKVDTVESLQAELAEKIALIKALEQKLKANDITLTDSEKLSSQKGSSSEGSATLVGTTEITATMSTSDSGGANSTDCSSAVSISNKTDCGQSSLCYANKSITSSEAAEAVPNNNAPGSLSSHIPSDDLIKIRNLESELEVAISNVTKFKGCLHETEARLQVLQEQNERACLDKELISAELRNQLKAANDELSHARNIIAQKEEVIKSLKKSQSDLKESCEKLEQNVKNGVDSLERVKGKLLEFRSKLKIDLPSMRQSLGELRDSVLCNRANLDQAVALAFNSIEKHATLYSASVLANAYAEYEKEKEGLRGEIQHLQQCLSQSHSEASEKVVHLTSANEELKSKTNLLEKDFARRIEEQRTDFDAALKDIETKHALEMEIELDKVRAEVKEGVEEVERLCIVRDDLNKELLELKEASEKHVAVLEKAHRDDIEALNFAHAKDRDLLNQNFKSDLEEKERDMKTQVTEIEQRLEAMQKNLAAEKMTAIAALTEQLVGEREAAAAERKQQLKEHETNLAEVLEKKQLDHVKNLTELKTHFDIEQESLLAEISKLKNRERSHMESQTERHLLVEVMTNSDTQTDIVLVTELMTHSETQTGMELLAEVISLTSSASYGSEEMIAHKQLSTLTDEKDGKDTETSIKLQQTIDDLNVQLANAQEKVAILEGEVTNLRTKQQEMTGSRTVDRQTEAMQEAGTSQQQKDFMKSSTVTTSFMVMGKEPSATDVSVTDLEAVKAKDRRIAQLEKKLMELSMTTSEREAKADRVSIRGCDKGDLVLLCPHERLELYAVFTIGTILHFLHSESYDTLGLKTSEAACKKPWILAEVVDKEYCMAKKPNNRFRVPPGTYFCRVKCKPWKYDPFLAMQERDVSRNIKTTKPELGAGARPKESEKK